MTVEGAPHLKEVHYPVFDCANRCGYLGVRYIHHSGHIRMMAAAQCFISGAISKTINLPNDADLETIGDAYMMSWKLGLKTMPSTGTDTNQPLSAKSSDKDETEATEEVVAVAAPAVPAQPFRRPLPKKRSGFLKSSSGRSQRFTSERVNMMTAAWENLWTCTRKGRFQKFDELLLYRCLETSVWHTARRFVDTFTLPIRAARHD